jgi:hypothetical protein
MALGYKVVHVVASPKGRHLEIGLARVAIRFDPEAGEGFLERGPRVGASAGDGSCCVDPIGRDLDVLCSA